MTPTLNANVVGLFQDRSAAERVLQELIASGYSRDQISVVSENAQAAAETPDLGPQTETGSGMAGGTGAAIGAGAGFLAGMLALAIPGIGPVLAIGPLAAGLMGAGIGAAAGGLIGALRDMGVPEDEAKRYEEALQGGGTLVSVHTTSLDADRAADILDRNGALDVDERLETLRAGRTPAVAPFKPEDSVRERQRARERRVGVFQPGITGSGPLQR